MAGESGVGWREMGVGGGEESGHRRNHPAWQLHDCIRWHSFGIIVSGGGGYDLVGTGGQAGVHGGPGGHHQPAARVLQCRRLAPGQDKRVFKMEKLFQNVSIYK